MEARTQAAVEESTADRDASTSTDPGAGRVGGQSAADRGRSTSSDPGAGKAVQSAADQYAGRIDDSPVDSAPDIANDFLTLYRVQTGTRVSLPEWLERKLWGSSRGSPRRYWFTDSRARAEWYAQRAGDDDPRLMALSMSTRDAEPFRISNLDPSVQSMSAQPMREFLVPESLAVRSRSWER